MAPEEFENDKPFMISNHDIIPYIMSLSHFMEDQGIEVRPLPKLVLSPDSKNEFEVFGQTAYYDPEKKMIKLYTKGRHIKDILRSFAHEMIHHNQNLKGDLNKVEMDNLKDPHYMTKDKYLLKMEADAYLRGNLYFRSWTELYK